MCLIASSAWMYRAVRQSLRISQNGGRRPQHSGTCVLEHPGARNRLLWPFWLHCGLEQSARITRCMRGLVGQVTLVDPKGSPGLDKIQEP